MELYAIIISTRNIYLERTYIIKDMTFESQCLK